MDKVPFDWSTKCGASRWALSALRTSCISMVTPDLSEHDFAHALANTLLPSDGSLMATLAQQGMQKGLQDGIQKGLQEGLDQGLAHGRRQTLARLLAQVRAAPDLGPGALG